MIEYEKIIVWLVNGNCLEFAYEEVLWNDIFELLSNHEERILNFKNVLIVQRNITSVERV